MKILYLATRFPFPPLGGHKLRVYNFLKYLSLNHKVTLICLLSPIDKGRLNSDLKAPSEPDDVLKRVEIKVIKNSAPRGIANAIKAISPSGRPFQLNLFTSRKVENYLPNLGKNSYDLIIFHLTRTGQFIPYFQKGVRILDIVDALVFAYGQSYKFCKSLSSLLKRMEMPR
ncbi:MAG: hypothetical protein KAX49_20930, partial [Halanaerobiales bacterium]|nr:hypothetical protein [Halanaerobiales bacterium]